MTVDRFASSCVARGAIRSALKILRKADEPEIDDLYRARAILLAAIDKLDQAIASPP